MSNKDATKKTKDSTNFRILYQKHGAGDVRIQIQHEPGRYASLLMGDVKDLRELGDLITAVREDILQQPIDGSNAKTAKSELFDCLTKYAVSREDLLGLSLDEVQSCD